MEFKHFEIIIRVLYTSFSFECSTTHEAYDAISDIVGFFPDFFPPNHLDEVTKTLVQMEEGKLISKCNCKYSIFVRDGEV